jgi:hypothetical protein
MYPSGSWKGWWEQRPTWGRQTMKELILYFDAGTIEGSGQDVIGKFTFTGTYDTVGRVRMIKQYIGRHQVLYEGNYDGEGTITGQWSIGALWRGPFALTPARSWVDPDAPIESL